MKLEMKKPMREKEIPEYKIKLVADIAQKIKTSKTLLIASTKNLPSSQFHEIKKNLRGKAEISVAKKSIVIRAIEKSGKTALQPLKESIGADVALFFSDMDPFSLSGLLTDSQSAAKAKAGDVAPEDIHVEPQPTDLVPGPAISELAGVGLKVAVEGGKLAIKQPHTIAKAGEVIKENVASVMAKLGITPMKVGFEPIAAYDSQADKVYFGIKIDKKATLDEVKDSIKRALGLAINLKIVIKETLSYFLAKAAMEEKALQTISEKHHSHHQNPQEAK
ncbi:50S ribosomal protein L10 [Candidatus Pacearchaeota archaeon]|nr:50S ribosomal protein L10 [Candidatus Pacearchaeota archaeon]